MTPTPSLRFVLTSILMGTLLALWTPSGSSASVETLHAPLSPSTTQAQPYNQVVVQADPAGALVAVTLRFPVGSAQDPGGEEGTAHLLGLLLEAEAARRFSQEAASVDVQVDRHEFLVTLLAPPDRWTQLFGELERLVRAASFSGADVERVRRLHAERLQFELGAPGREFEIEQARVIFGSGSPSARPTGGLPASVEGIPSDGPSRFRQRHLDPGQATVAVVGPVAMEDVRRTIPGELRTVPGVSPFRISQPEPQWPPAEDTARAEAPPDDTAQAEMAAVRAPEASPGPRTRLREVPPRPLTVPAEPSAAPAWTAGERIVVDRQLTSTWVTVAWSLPPGTPATLMEFLAFALQEELVPSPPDPGLYGAETRVKAVEGKPVLVTALTVDPRVTGRWEERALGALDQLADTPPTGSFFELLRRRYRNALFLELADPEGRSTWLARIAATAPDGRIPDIGTDVWRLSREGLAGLAASAGPPRVLLMGPEAMFQGGVR